MCGRVTMTMLPRGYRATPHRRGRSLARPVAGRQGSRSPAVPSPRGIAGEPGGQPRPGFAGLPQRPGDPARYQDWTEKPVWYFTVVDGKTTLSAGTCGPVTRTMPCQMNRRRQAALAPRTRACPGSSRLREAKARGLRPAQTLLGLYGDPSRGGRGRPLPGSLIDTPNAAAVEALAAGDRPAAGGSASE